MKGMSNKFVWLKSAIASCVLTVMILATIATNMTTIQYVVDSNNAADELFAGQSSVKASEIIVQACKLMGKSYPKSGASSVNIKGAENPYSANPTFANENGISSVDCSGLIFWTLGKLGISMNNLGNPLFRSDLKLPADTLHWVTYYKNGIAYYWSEIQAGNLYSGKNADIEYSRNGATQKRVKVLKASDNITSDLRYYQYKDSTGAVKNLPAGTVIVSTEKDTWNYKEVDHSWITLGDLGTTDVKEVAKILVGMGVPQNLLIDGDINGNFNIKVTHRTASGDPVNAIYKDSNTCTYWRIESQGTRGVNINNGDPNEGDSFPQQVSSKKIGEIWAFQFAEESQPQPKGSYSLDITKKSTSDGSNLSEKSEALGGATFNVVQYRNSGDSIVDSKKSAEKSVTTSKGKAVNVYNNVNIDNVSSADWYKITETSSPANYDNKTWTVNLKVYKKLVGEEYKVEKVDLKYGSQTKTVIAGNSAFVEVDGQHATGDGDVISDALKNIYGLGIEVTDSNISLTWRNEMKDGSYGFFVRKVDEKGNDVSLSNTNIFDIKHGYEGGAMATPTNMRVSGSRVNCDFDIDPDKVNTNEIITITETSSPNGFVKYNNKIEITITKAIGTNNKLVANVSAVSINGVPVAMEADDDTKEAVKKGWIDSGNVKIDWYNNIIGVQIKNKSLDLALRKYILKTGDTDVNRWKEPKIDVSPLKDENNTTTTAKYSNEKTPIQVNAKDVVTYGISVYNEGSVAGYADYIIDDVPAGVTMVAPEYDEQGKAKNLNAQFGWKMYELVENGSVDTSKVSITYGGKTYVVTNDPSKAVIIGTDYWARGKEHDGKTGLMTGYNNGDSLDSREVRVQFKVNEDAECNVNIVNKAQIYRQSDSEGNNVTEDIDSTPGVWEETPRDDDQDYEVIYIEPKIDLSLRKYIVKAGDEVVNRWGTTKIDVSPLKDDDDKTTTAKYSNVKDPIKVKINDVVTYAISVYNEGNVDGYANYIIDDVPEDVTMVAPEYDEKGIAKNLNAQYGWKMYELAGSNVDIDSKDVITYDGKNYVVTNDPSKAVIIGTDYWAKGKEHDGKTGLIKKYDNGDSLDSREVQVQFTVNSNAKNKVNIINKAQIYSQSDSNGNVVSKDIDSTPGVWEETPRDDDQDYEVIYVENSFDLSLRKFITKVNGKDVDVSREPNVDCSKLVSGKSTTATYTHTKEPVLVNPKDVVDYTIRIYNEGGLDGYANLVMDDIPEGAEMIAPDFGSDGKAGNLNAEYRWVMYKKLSSDEDLKDIQISSDFAEPVITYKNENYVVTDDAKQAVLIVTDYLSISNGKIIKDKDGKDVNSNLLKAFDLKLGKMTEDNYRDIKVQFVVKDLENPKEEAGKIITNYAQITADSDGEGNPVTDRDSTPNVWENPPRDDDQDYDRLKVGYFDLALYKWVTTASITENGKTTEYESDHTQDDKTNLVKVSIPKDGLNKVAVKFKYTIKVENQGTIAGKATEIKDHIPVGLKFDAQDNIKYGWQVAGDDESVIVSDYLKDTVLNPGESAEVEVVLTWINGSNNMGQKINFAEISEDYNDYGWPDVDSTPNNFKDTPVEDDEDGDVVKLEIRTGVSNVNLIYGFAGLAFLMIVAGGVFCVKKFV